MKTQLFLVGALSLAIVACSNSDSSLANTDTKSDFLKTQLNQHHQFQTDYSVREKAEAQRALRQPRNKHRTADQKNGEVEKIIKSN